MIMYDVIDSAKLSPPSTLANTFLFPWPETDS